MPKRNTAIHIPPLEAETGQESFLRFSHHLLFDLENFKDSSEYVVWYMAIALNLFMHNASHRPRSSDEKVQKLEADHLLFYSRSQTKHPLRTRHDQFSKMDTDTRPTSIAPLNPALRNMLRNTITPGADDEDNTHREKQNKQKRRKLLAKLHKINATRGFPTNPTEKIDDYFSLFIAHSGLRTNTFRMLTQGLTETATRAHTTDHALRTQALEQKFRAQLPKRLPKKMQRLSLEEANRRITDIHTRFQLLNAQHTEPLTQNLQAKILKQKSDHATEVCEKLKKLWKNEPFKALLTVKTHGPGCLVTTLDSEKFKFHEVNSKSHTEHATNVILGFFAGLLNYYAKKRGLVITVERRQSFGFLRATLTDAGELNLRLSLGLEPPEFIPVITEALNQLAKTLHQRQQFPAKLPKMKSEEKQWQATLEAEYHLDQMPSETQAAFTTAFSNYLDQHIVADTQHVSDPSQLKLAAQIAKPVMATTSSTILFPLLSNVVKFALTTAERISALQNTHFPHSLWHGLLKLYQYCDNALSLLRNLSHQEISRAYREANYYLDNILEYLIALDSLEQLHDTHLNKPNTKISTLTTTERHYAAEQLHIPQTSLNVYLLDSGQQAVITSWLAMDNEIFFKNGKDERGQKNIYTFDHSYYELNAFLKDVGGLQVKDRSTAAIAFMDVTQLNHWNVAEFDTLEALIIDTTRHPDLSQPLLQRVIQEARSKGCWVMLAASALKHDELGLDKYSAGKIVTIPPNDDASLSETTVDLLEKISGAAAHPTIAAYLQMVNEICRDKPQPSQTGIFHHPAVEEDLVGNAPHLNINPLME